MFFYTEKSFSNDVTGFTGTDIKNVVDIKIDGAGYPYYEGVYQNDCSVGKLSFDGEADDKHIEQMVSTYKKLIVENSPCGYYGMGNLYLEKKYQNFDPSLGVKHILIAAKLEFSPAEVLLSYFYSNGVNVEKSMDSAIFWGEKAWLNGSKYGMLALFHIYKKDKVFKQDPDKAIYWMEEAIVPLADLNVYPAVELGYRFYDGSGVKKDHKKAIKYFTLYVEAAKNANVETIALLGYLHHREKIYTKSYKYFERAAHAGLHDGMYMLGKYYLNGFHVKKDKMSAYRWFKKSAKHGGGEAWGEVRGFITKYTRFSMLSIMLEKKCNMELKSVNSEIYLKAKTSIKRYKEQLSKLSEKNLNTIYKIKITGKLKELVDLIPGERSLTIDTKDDSGKYCKTYEENKSGRFNEIRSSDDIFNMLLTDQQT